MAETIIAERDHPLRPSIEGFIRAVYEDEYGAAVGAFPSLLLGLAESDGSILCAAALRTERDPFFSEAYLDEPIEQILSGLAGASVDRAQIFEVSTLASRAPKATTQFINSIVAYGQAQGFAWSFFTLTRRLRLIVERLGLEPIFLAEADPRRVSNVERWGDYYTHQPCVFAVRSPAIPDLAVPSKLRGDHAFAL
jgi:hypothetical protein